MNNDIAHLLRNSIEQSIQVDTARRQYKGKFIRQTPNMLHLINAEGMVSIATSKIVAVHTMVE